jgi:GntR family transcriptional regulator
MERSPGYLDKHSPIPLYYQLANRLRTEIRNGTLRPGVLIGTEKEIGDHYQVSRATVRQALDELEREGLLDRITGRGTFVSSPHLTVQLPTLVSFTEEMRRRGIEAGSILLAFDTLQSPADIARRLGCEPGQTIIRIRRVRTGNGTPLVFGDHFLAPFLQLEQRQLEPSLYETIERQFGIQIREAVHTIRAGLANLDEARHLEIAERDAVLRFESTSYAADGQPVLWETVSANATLYDLSVRLTQR